MVSQATSVAPAQATFDDWLARQARDDGMLRVDEHADNSWKRAVREAIQRVARTHKEFTTDAVLQIVESQAVRTHEPRALGPMMMAAMRQGLIERTDRMVKSCDVSRHAADKRVWKSLVFGDRQ